MANDSDMGVLLMGQCMLAESSDGEGDDNRPPPYRAPIAYEKEWSLADSDMVSSAKITYGRGLELRVC